MYNFSGEVETKKKKQSAGNQKHCRGNEDCLWRDH